MRFLSDRTVMLHLKATLKDCDQTDGYLKFLPMPKTIR